jgi:hypothetical protein
MLKENTPEKGSLTNLAISLLIIMPILFFFSAFCSGGVNNLVQLLARAIK